MINLSLMVFQAALKKPEMGSAAFARLEQERLRSLGGFGTTLAKMEQLDS